MSHRWITSCALASAVFTHTASTRAQDGVAVFQGPAGGAGTVRVYDAANGALLASPPEFAGVRFLPIDFCGRNALQELSPDRPRRIADVAGASRLRLQQNRGSLYHFSRAEAGGTSTFGYVLIEPDASIRILVERPGTGTTGTTDPFSNRIAVAPDGSAFLAATLAPAGGDLLEVAIAAPVSVVDHTSNLQARRFYPQSLVLGSTFGLAVTPRGVLRFDRGVGATAAQVHFGGAGAPSFYSGETTSSPDSSHVAFTAGDSAQALFAYSCGRNGDAQRAGNAPAPLSRAGSSLDGLDGPWLAVSDDGAWCAWRTEPSALVPSTECWLGRVAAPVSELPEQITSDARFNDTLDEIGLFVFRGPHRLVFAVGERTDGELGIESADIFSATVQPGAPPLIQNLSATSGETQPPFQAIPSLKPERIVDLPAATLVHSRQSGSGTLYAVRDGQIGLQTVLPNVKTLDIVEPAGANVLFLVRRGNSRELYRVPADLFAPPSLIMSASDSISVDRTAARADGWIGYVVNDGVDSWLDRTLLPTGQTDQLSGVPSFFGAAVSWSAQGRLAFTRVSAGTTSHWAWPIGGMPLQLLAPAASGQILPGS